MTIGVELAARPELLLFLDEPTSGLDSDTAWSIIDLLQKLARNGQAILCTIHQPSGVLLQMFDKLLFLSQGRSLYYGDLGDRAEVMIAYFEHHGAPKCGPEANPAEWVLDFTSNVANTKNAVDWAEVWKASEERSEIKKEILKLRRTISKSTLAASRHAKSKYAAPWLYQLVIVTGRILQDDWRTPSYLWAKVLSVVGMVSMQLMHLMLKSRCEMIADATSRQLSMASLSGNLLIQSKEFRIKSSPSSCFWLFSLPKFS